MNLALRSVFYFLSVSELSEINQDVETYLEMVLGTNKLVSKRSSSEFMWSYCVDVCCWSMSLVQISCLKYSLNKQNPFWKHRNTPYLEHPEVKELMMGLHWIQCICRCCCNQLLIFLPSCQGTLPAMIHGMIFLRWVICGFAFFLFPPSYFYPKLKSYSF